MASRDLWLTHPRIKAAAEQQLGKVERKPTSAYTRLQNAIAYNGKWAMDRVDFDTDTGRLGWTFIGVDLIGTNTLLRCHQAKVNKYREQWKERTAALILQNQNKVRRWCEQAKYPVRYEAFYVTRHRVLMDEDNLIGAAKVVLDEIVRQSAIPDDTPDFVRHPLVESRRGTLGALHLVLLPLEKAMITTATRRWAETIN